MKIKCLILAAALIFPVFLAGCCSPSGAFATSEERATNMGESIQNIALDGDGVN